MDVLTPTYSKDINTVSFSLTKDVEINLIKLAQNGNGIEKTRARNKLLESQLKKIVSIARRYCNNSNSLTDLMAAGAIGFDYAIDKFNLSKGIRFITYYVFWVRDYMNRAVHSNHTIRPPMHIAKTNSKSDEELAKLSKANRRNKNDKVYMGFSINSPVNSETTTTYEHTLTNNMCTENEVHNKMLIEKALAILPLDNVARGLILKFHYDGVSLNEIAKERGVSKQRISAIINNALAKIRKNIEL